MARVHGITYRQSQFLRALVEHPSGPPEDQWPHPTILRRWLRRPPFRSALDSLLGQQLTNQLPPHRGSLRMPAGLTTGE